MSYIHGKSLVKIAIADDHTLLRQSLSSIINSFENCKVILETASGAELIERIVPDNLPDLILIDLAMPDKNGFETIKILAPRYPELKFIVISIYQGEEMIVRLLKSGAQGFIHKSEDAIILKHAIYEIMRKGYYFTDKTALKIVHHLLEGKSITAYDTLSDEEISFLKLITTEKPYKEIAQMMNITLRHAEYIRNTLFHRFNVQNRTGLAVKAIDKGLAI